MRRFSKDKMYTLEDLAEVLRVNLEREKQQIERILKILRDVGVEEVPGFVMVDHAALGKWNRPYGLKSANRAAYGIVSQIQFHRRVLREIAEGVRQPWNGEKR